MRQRAENYLVFVLCAAGTAGLLWLAARFLLPWAAPFLLAYFVAAVLEPAVRVLIRHGWRRRAAAGVMTAAVLMLLVWAAWAIAVKGVAAAAELARLGPELIALAVERLELLEMRAFDYAASAPVGVGAYISSAVESIGRELYSLPAYLSQYMLDAAARFAQSGPDALLFAVTAGLGTYFVSASFPETTEFIISQLPRRTESRLEGFGQSLRRSFGGLLRAQLMLTAITFAELFIAFTALKIKSAAELAAVTAVVDALPVFGTGTVLLPWAAGELIMGNVSFGVVLVLLWVGTNLVRSCIQARLMGAQIGLAPLPSLLSIYIGWRAWGIKGMLVFPLIFVSLQQLNDKGIIRLWKSIK